MMRVHCVEKVKRHQGVLLDVDYTPFDTVTLAKMARIKGLKLWSSQNCIARAGVSYIWNFPFL